MVETGCKLLGEKFGDDKVVGGLGEFWLNSVCVSVQHSHFSGLTLELLDSMSSTIRLFTARHVGVLMRLCPLLVC